MTIPKFRTAKVGIKDDNHKEFWKNFSFLSEDVSHSCGKPQNTCLLSPVFLAKLYKSTQYPASY